MLNENEQEVTSKTINKYISSIYKLSLATGKLDNILLYIEQTYSNDKFLIHSLSSILKDITIVNQDNKYERTKIQYDNSIPSVVNIPHLSSDINVNNAPKNNFRDETTPKIFKVPLTHPETPIVEDLGVNKDIAEDEYYYKFENSTMLGKMWYIPKAKLLKMKYVNGRLYHHLSFPEVHVKHMIILDNNSGSASKYFNSIKKDYEYREISKDNNETIGE